MAEKCGAKNGAGKTTAKAKELGLDAGRRGLSGGKGREGRTIRSEKKEEKG